MKISFENLLNQINYKNCANKYIDKMMFGCSSLTIDLEFKPQV